MGKVERGEHMPTLAIIFKIAGALECSTAVLMSEAESQLAAAAHPREGVRDWSRMAVTAKTARGVARKSPAAGRADTPCPDCHGKHRVPA
ncbi:hypothetical protein G6F58_013485 [Rhizopus delemar]|nr:hypothetical protein G6F58_013485 [Rhizopus delemar]